MRSKHAFLLVALMVSLGLAAAPAFAQGTSSTRYGVGASLTQLKDTNGLIPITFIALDAVTIEFGVDLFTGGGTNFGLQAGGFYYPYELKHGKIGFGLQFNLLSIGNPVANQAGTTVGVIGLGAEYRAEINDSLDLGLRVFPLQLTLLSGNRKTQVGVFAPGLAAGFYF